METVRVLLISTYDLGRQPFGLASPAAWLRKDGVDVDCVDTSRDALTDAHIAEAGLVAFYLPMHTATRLAAPLIARVRHVNPSARLAAYGLYAPLNAIVAPASRVSSTCSDRKPRRIWSTLTQNAERVENRASRRPSSRESSAESREPSAQSRVRFIPA